MIWRWRIELPKDVTLDGELFGGRGDFQSTVGIVKTAGSKGWKNITFQVRLYTHYSGIIVSIHSPPSIPLAALFAVSPDMP